jgi:hypothetical protein
LKTLYGLRDSPLVRFREVTSFMGNISFEPLCSEACVFVNKDRSVWIYVDDMAIAAAMTFQIDCVPKQLRAVFSVIELGEVNNFVGI